MTKVRYGIIGASGIAQRRVMPAFAHCQHSELAAIVSRSPEKAAALAHEFGSKPFDCREAMFPEVDAVYVATPVHCHLDDARAVLKAGKHLLLEKPLARTPVEGREILALANQSGKMAMEAYMMRFHPAHIAIRQAVQAGKLGRITYARARLACWYPDLPGAWRQDPQLSGGGALMDLGSHLIDLLSWILGPIVSVRGLCNTQLFRYSADDSATLILEFAHGTHGIVEAYFSTPDAAGEGVLEIIGTQGRIQALGTIGQTGDGTIHWQSFPPQTAYDAQQNPTPQPPRSETEQFAPTDLYARQLDYFSQCILTESAPSLNTFEEGVGILEWIEKAYAPTGVSS